MSGKFKIYKDPEPAGGYPWVLDYPDDFEHDTYGQGYDSFADALAAFAELEQRWCIIGCGRGAVIDTLTGWECTYCGSSDDSIPAPGAPR